MPVSWTQWQPGNLRRCWHDGAGNLKSSSTTSTYTGGNPTAPTQIKRSIVDASGNIKQGLTNAADNDLKASVKPAAGGGPVQRYFYQFNDSVINVPPTLDNAATSGIQRVEFDIEYQVLPSTTADYNFGVFQSNNEQLRSRGRFFGGDNNIALSCGDNSLILSNVQLQLNTKHHVRFRWNGSTCDVLVDAETPVSEPYNPLAQSRTDGTFIGNHRSAAQTPPFIGIISDLKFMSFDGNTTFHHWPINDNSNTIVDIVGGSNGTITRAGTGSWVLI